MVPRGSGTSLAGGALPTADSVILGVARLTRMIEVDYQNRFVRVEAGRTNLSVTGAVEASGFFYAPDPSSQLACAIAGNVAMNSGGAHCLKYGVTTNNLLGRDAGADGRHGGRAGRAVHGCRRARPSGRRLRLRGPARRRDRGDLADPAQARGRAAGADRLRLERGGGRVRRRHHQGRRPAGRDRVHGPALHRGLRGLRPCRLSGLRSAADRRGRGLGRRDRRAAGPDQADRPRPRPARAARGGGRRRGGADLARPEVGLRRDGPDRRLHVPRRDDPGLGPARGAAADRRDVRALRPAASPTCFTPATATCTR